MLEAGQHRGAQPAKGCGNQRRFTCPYHAWTYDINGRLISMPAKHRHTELHFDEMGLVELPSEERHGFIWAVLTPGAEIDVAAHLGVLDDEIGPGAMPATGLSILHNRSSLSAIGQRQAWPLTLQVTTLSGRI